MAQVDRGEIYRLIGLSVAVLLEGAAALSIALNISFLPLGAAYPYVVSVASWVLPVLMGLLSRRFEAAILLAVLPVFLLVLVYLAIHALVWNEDLLVVAAQAGSMAGTLVLVGGLGFFGWLIRRVLFGTKSVRMPAA